jgi:hypothetical protein
VEGSEEAEAEVVAVVPQGDLPDAHQVVRRAAPDPEALLLPAVRVVRVRQVVPGPEILPHPVVDPVDRQQLARSLGSLDRMGYLLSLTVPVRAPVLVFWGDFVAVESLDLPPVGIAKGAVATVGRLPVETSLSTRWFQPWRRGRNWEPAVVVSPSGSMFVGLEGG